MHINIHINMDITLIILLMILIFSIITLQKESNFDLIFKNLNCCSKDQRIEILIY
jgi:hypothetical protein